MIPENALDLEMRAAFEIKLARSAALRALIVSCGRDQVFHAWSLGWCQGLYTGIGKAKEALIP